LYTRSNVRSRGEVAVIIRKQEIVCRDNARSVPALVLGCIRLARVAKAAVVGNIQEKDT
jgi:hypothetical protein